MRAFCMECRHFHATGHTTRDGAPLGVCRARAPVLVPQPEGRAKGMWPVVGRDSWCGDFQEGDQ